MTDKLRRLFAGDEKLTVDRGPENRTEREACFVHCAVTAERDRLRAENARLTLALDEAMAGYAHVDPNTRRGDDTQASADDFTASRERGSFVPGISDWMELTIFPAQLEEAVRIAETRTATSAARTVDRLRAAEEFDRYLQRLCPPDPTTRDEGL